MTRVDPIDVIDRQTFQKELEKFFETDDPVVIRDRIKWVLKRREEIERMSFQTKFSVEEMISHIVSIHGDIFNRSTIRKLRVQLGKEV